MANPFAEKEKQNVKIPFGTTLVHTERDLIYLLVLLAAIFRKYVLQHGGKPLVWQTCQLNKEKPYSDLLSAIGKEKNYSEKLYDVMRNHLNTTIAGDDRENTWHYCDMQNGSLHFYIDDRERKGVFAFIMTIRRANLRSRKSKHCIII